MYSTKQNYDARLVILYCGMLLLCIASVVHLSELGSAGTPLKCFQLNQNLTGLDSIDCNGSVRESGSIIVSPEASVFYFNSVPINEAGLALLQTIVGVGPKLAQSITEYRELNGPFAGVESLKKLPGVGEKRAQYLVTQFSFD